MINNIKFKLLILTSVIVFSNIQPLQAADFKTDTHCIKADKIVSPTLGLSVHPPFDKNFWTYINDLGVTWLRTDLYWNTIEPVQGKQDWSEIENFLNEAQKRHIEILLIINHPPEWATKDHSKFHVLVNQFAKDAAKFSNGRVSAWEAFNEPNLPGYGWPFSNLSLEENAALYASTVNAINFGLRSTGDNHPIIAGALSPNGQDPAIFINSAFSQLDKACYDAVSIHPYGEAGKLTQIIQTTQTLLKSKKTPIWITEYGSDTASEHAKILNDAVQSLGFKTPLFWFTLRDFSIFEQYGMINAFGYKRPFYDQFKKTTGDLERKSKNP